MAGRMGETEMSRTTADASGRSSRRSALCPLASVTLILFIVVSSGCGIFEPTIAASRAEGHWVMWTGSELSEIDDDAEAYGFEVTIGTDAEPEMGQLYMGFAYSVALLDDADYPGETRQHRAGVRFRSSVLDHNSASYPYAAVGAFFEYMESEGEPTPDPRVTIGIEGGYGYRFGFGSWQKGKKKTSLALDVEIISSWARYWDGFDSLSTRVGMGLALTY